MGKGDDPNRAGAQPLPAPGQAAPPTERQQRKLRGLRISHPGLIEYGVAEDDSYVFAKPGGFKRRGRDREYVSPQIGRILPDGKIVWGLPHDRSPGANG